MAVSLKSCTFAADFTKIASDDGLRLGKKCAFCTQLAPSLQPLSNKKQNEVDPLAQSVEHNTFNVGVLGSSPKRITFKNRQIIDYQSFADFLISQMHHFCTT